VASVTFSPNGSFRTNGLGNTRIYPIDRNAMTLLCVIAALEAVLSGFFGWRALISSPEARLRISVFAVIALFLAAASLARALTSVVVLHPDRVERRSLFGSSSIRRMDIASIKTIQKAFGRCDMVLTPRPPETKALIVGRYNVDAAFERWFVGIPTPKAAEFAGAPTAPAAHDWLRNGTELIQRRRRLLAPGFVGLFIFLVGLIAVLALTHDTDAGINWSLIVVPAIVVLFGGALLWFCAVQLVNPARLTISKSELIIQTFRKQSRWRWKDISNFRLRRSRHGIPIGVRFDIADLATGTFIYGALPGSWPISLKELAANLEETRRRNAGAAEFGNLTLKRRPMTRADKVSIAVVWILFILWFGWIALRIDQDHQADRISDQYIKQTTFQELPNCPRVVALHDFIPIQCDDPRYKIRQDYARYHLPRFKGSHWLRLGSDAVAIGYCGPRACWVVNVINGKFPSK
jgi:hypothetical protein